MEKCTNERRGQVFAKAYAVLMATYDTDAACEAALQAANEILTTYDLEEAAQPDREAPIYGEISCEISGMRLPSWVGILSDAIMAFTDTRYVCRKDAHGPSAVVFQGEKANVTLARDYFAAAVDAVFTAGEEFRAGWRPLRVVEEFCTGAARAIAEPLVLMAAARWAAYLKAADESGSAAWEIASEKAAAIAEKIGRLR